MQCNNCCIPEKPFYKVGVEIEVGDDKISSEVCIDTKGDIVDQSNCNNPQDNRPTISVNVAGGGEVCNAQEGQIYGTIGSTITASPLICGTEIVKFAPGGVKLSVTEFTGGAGDVPTTQVIALEQCGGSVGVQSNCREPSPDANTIRILPPKTSNKCLDIQGPNEVAVGAQFLPVGGLPEYKWSFNGREINEYGVIISIRRPNCLDEYLVTLTDKCNNSAEWKLLHHIHLSLHH